MRAATVLGVLIAFAAVTLALAAPEGASVCEPVYVFFQSGEAALAPQAIPAIAAAAKIMLDRNLPAAVTGHSDGLEGDDTALSERRALAVKRELTRLGVKADLLQTTGHGLAEPLTPSAPGVAESFNRYVIIDFCGPDRFRR